MPHALASKDSQERPQGRSTIIQGCYFYNTGRVCYRARDGLICKYNHDSRLRAEAFAQKNASKKTAAAKARSNHLGKRDVSHTISQLKDDETEELEQAYVSIVATQSTTKPAISVKPATSIVKNHPQASTQVKSSAKGRRRKFIHRDGKVGIPSFNHDEAASGEGAGPGQEKQCKKQRRLRKKWIPLKDLDEPVRSEDIQARDSYSIASRSNLPSKSELTSKDATAPAPLDPNIPKAQSEIQSLNLMSSKRWGDRNLSPIVLGKYPETFKTYSPHGHIRATTPKEMNSQTRCKVKKDVEVFKAPTYFHLFSSLPHELQADIWDYYIFGEEEQCVISMKRRTSRDGISRRIGFDCRSPLPTALAVSRRLQGIGLRHYKLSFGTVHRSPKSWFNYQNDRLFLCNDGLHDLLISCMALKRHERAQVRLLALPLRDWIKGDTVEFAKGVSCFPSLESLHVLVGDGKEDEKYSKASTKILERIRELVSKVWKVNNGPYDRPRPKVHIKSIPAPTAKQFKIDELEW